MLDTDSDLPKIGFGLLWSEGIEGLSEGFI
jgi:hypothetical protein